MEGEVRSERQVGRDGSEISLYVILEGKHGVSGTKETYH